MASKDCSICCDKFTSVLRKPVTCASCQYCLCTNCLKQCLTSTTNDPNCPNCKHEWDHDFLMGHLPKTFLNDSLKKHRENVLFERQVAMLPATQPYVARQIKKEKLGKQIEDLLKVQKEIKAQIRELQNQMYRLGETHLPNPVHANGNGDNEEYVRPCPGDGCKGYLAKRTWKCGICDIKVCNKCLQVKPKDKDEEHVCKEEDVESAKLLAKECKQCPKCSALCYKVDGCSQVWCYSCKTAFNWNTLQIDTGRIHAPDYYNWLRSQNNGVIPREQGDDPCAAQAGIPTAGVWRNFVSTKIIALNTAQPKMGPCVNQSVIDNLWAVHRGLVHVEHYEMPYFRTTAYNDFRYNLDNRVQYLLNKLSADQFKVKLQRNEKDRRRKQAIFNVYEILVQVSGDIMRRMMADTYTKDNVISKISGYERELASIKDYANLQLKKISSNYGATVSLLDEVTWRAVNYNAKTAKAAAKKAAQATTAVKA